MKKKRKVNGITKNDNFIRDEYRQKRIIKI